MDLWMHLISEQWYDNQNIAVIDQGPIVVMIEIIGPWAYYGRCFMTDRVKAGLRQTGFQSPDI